MLLSVTTHEPKAIAYYILAGVLLILFYMIAKEIENYKKQEKLPPLPKGQAWKDFKKNVKEIFHFMLGIVSLFFMSFLFFAFFHLCFFSGFDFDPESFIGPSIFITVLVIVGIASYGEMTKNIKR